jgi:hypothetical protein
MIIMYVQVHAGQETDVQTAMTFILDITKEDNHKLFTMMTPQDWEFMMNPGESGDTFEAFKVIRNSILAPLMSMVPTSTIDEKQA